MNSPTTDRLHRSILALVLPVLMLMGSGVARAQIVVANPLEWAVLVEGNELINGQINSEIEGQTQTAVLQGTIAAEFTQIKNWENKYNAYLKSVEGYASSLKAATHLYNDGVRLFINLCDIRKAITNNPQGVAATFSMNNLYAETATELVTVYTTPQGRHRHRRRGQHAHRGRALEDPLDDRGQSEELQPQALPALPFPQILYPPGCMVERHRRHPRP